MNGRFSWTLLVVLFVSGRGMADDNTATAVRRVPKLGITVSPEVTKELEEGLAGLKHEYELISSSEFPRIKGLLPDVWICYKAVHDALAYQEFFSEKEVEKARELLKLGRERATALSKDRANWARDSGLVVRGYVSRIDGSVQPYGLVIPDRDPPGGEYRLDVWFHGRGEALSEVNFLDERRKHVGEFAPEDTIVLHPYGRYCNANKFAGEVDVLEAIEAVKKNYRIDENRISVRGFSMGGAACWQFAVHQSDRWFAANPGAGFSETPRFLKVFQKETLAPTWFEKALWHWYDCTDWAENLAQCPTVAYSGEIDSQKQAADVMAEALEKEGIELLHVIGPKTAHSYHPAAKKEVEARLASIALTGRRRFPREVRFTTYTLKYNTMGWVTVDSLGEHWEKGQVRALYENAGVVEATTQNVTGLTLSFPPGFAPFEMEQRVTVLIDGAVLSAGRPKSDRSWSVSLERASGSWKVKASALESQVQRLHKKHDLQGPIDDAFMDSFLFVKPTGKSPRPQFQGWCESEMARAIEHWRRQFRGEARVKEDKQVGEDDLAGSNLVLWGDPESNSVLRGIAASLPIKWNEKVIRAGERAFDAETHALIMIYPNPLNPNRYVVLNSGFTFREYDYLNNARQVAKLPDWGVIDLRTPPDSRASGKVAAADFFGEKWELRPERKGP